MASGLFEEDLTELTIPPAPVRITEPEYRGITVDTRFTPSAALLTHVEGFNWTVNYYSQVVDVDKNLEGQQVNRRPKDQQYILIHKLDIKVQTPLSDEDQDQQDKTKRVTGSAVIPPDTIIPNEGDMFLADGGDGQEYVFQVTSSHQKSMFKQSVYEIEYQLIDYSTEERRYDFGMKTVKELYYHKDFRYHGQNGLLEEGEHNAVNEIQNLWGQINRRWWLEFFSREFATLIVPGQSAPVYDPYFARFCRAMSSTTDAPQIQKLRLLNGYEDDHFVQTVTILDVLKNQDRTLFPYVKEEMGYTSVKNFSRDPMLESIYHSGIPFTVYPHVTDLEFDFRYISRSQTLVANKLNAGASRSGRINQMLQDANLLGLPYGDSPLVHEIGDSPYYIFSEKFYAGEPGLSKIECAVKDYIEGKAIDPKLLVAFFKTCHAWGSVERFYLTPIILMLANSWMRRL